MTNFVALTVGWPDRWRDDFEERAAILEFDAGLNRNDAERKAFAQVAKLKRRVEDAS